MIQRRSNPTVVYEESPSIPSSSRSTTGTVTCSDHDREFKAALHRLTDLYEKSYELADYAVALRVCKEIHKLLGLYDKPVDGERIDPDAYHQMLATLDLIRDHLIPLGLADEAMPIEEHARIAAGIAMEHLSHKQR